MIKLYIIVAVVAYLLGSIPFGYILVKTFRGQDIRQTGSGNIGATNVARSGAKGLGAATLVLDTLKGALPVWLASVLAHSSYNVCGTAEPCIPAVRLMSVAAFSAVAGHVFPVWLKFRGGKGVATALGVFIVLFPWATLIALGVFAVTAAVSRYISLGSILGAISFPIAAYFVQLTDWVSLCLGAAVSLVIVAKHRQNIRRLLGGSESRFGSKKAPAPEGRA